ncbi:hypothetical protein GCM10023318_34510 [Nocardia callitridis]|uniref:Uncharacterized protein n=1 Tax=Nocardia callitridis TaxID=648753 RepID=A0ABP9KDM3_9NOCA
MSLHCPSLSHGVCPAGPASLRGAAGLGRKFDRSLRKQAIQTQIDLTHARFEASASSDHLPELICPTVGGPQNRLAKLVGGLGDYVRNVSGGRGDRSAVIRILLA